MSARAHIVMLAVVVAMVGRPARQAHGENFFKRKAQGAVKAISEVFAPGVSTLVDAASTPILHNVEGTGRRLLYDFEGVAARRLDQAGTLVDKAVDNAFDETGKLVSRVDASLEARILQVTTSANSVVDNVGAEARATIRTADQMIASNIARVQKAALAVLDRVDVLAAQRLAQIDEILRLRLGDVGQMIQGTLTQVDEIAKARLEQVDEIAGRRLGNVDVIATKQGLSLEAMLIRLATLLGAFTFFAFLMWSAWNSFVVNSNLIARLREGGTTPAEKHTMVRKIGLWTLQTLFAAACFGAVIVVAGYLPRDAQQRSTAQVAEHAHALTNAVNAYDFAAVRYHHSQLEILRPGDPTFRGLAIKAALLRDLFERPARLHTAEGLRGLERQLDAARDLIPHDPDLLVIEGYVIWRVGASRVDELDAADLCAQALALRPRGDWTMRFLPGRFLLRPLAENYVRQFLHDPFVADSIEETAQLDRIKAARIPPASHLRELEQIFAYNALVARLDEDLTPAYLEMLEAHVHYAAAATAKPYVVSTATATRKARSDAAQKVVAAWLAFDHALAESDALAGDPAALNAFTLDDAVLSQALFFYAEAHDDRGQEIPLDPKNPPPVRLPVFFDGYAAPAAKKPGAGFAPTAAPRPADQQALRLRVAAAPIRIRWARRLEPLLGKTTQDVLAKEEAERFRALEQRLHDLTTSYVEVRKAAAGTVDLTSEAAKQRLATHAATAARAAADMGLWRLDDPSAPIGQRERKPFATTILDAAVTAGATIDARTQAAVVEAQRKRRLRFL